MRTAVQRAQATLSRSRSIRVLLLAALIEVAAAGSLIAGTDLVSRTIPANDDRASRGAPVSIHFASPIELDTNGDGTFTRVASGAIEAGSADITVAVNASSGRNRVRVERDLDGIPGTPASAPVDATASWSLGDWPPMLRIVPAAGWDPGSLFRISVFEDASDASPSARRLSDGAPAARHDFLFYTLAAGATGAVTHATFTPPSLGYVEDYNIYLPAGYGSSPTQTYAALYLLHGGNNDYNSWFFGGGTAKEILDRLIDQGNIEPVIAVSPDGNGGPNKCAFFLWNHLWSNDWNGAYKYGDYTAFDLPAQIEANYRARPDGENRGVAGLSMGGFGSGSQAFGHPSRFSFLAPLSGWEASVRLVSGPSWPSCGATFWTTIPNFGACFGEMVQAAIGPAGSTDLTQCFRVNPGDLADGVGEQAFKGWIFIGHGDADTTATVRWSDDISCSLTARGASHCYKRPPGAGHTWDFWNSALENDLLPRFDSKTTFRPLPAGINAACVNPNVIPLADTDGDGVLDDGDRSGTIGDAPCATGGVNCDDNCRDDPNGPQSDFDHDGVGDTCDPDDDGDGNPDAADCAPLDPAGGRPGEVHALTASGKPGSMISWAPEPLSDRYDVSRGLLSALGASGYGPCFQNDVVGTSVQDGSTPPTGNGWFYLVRGTDVACGGPGSWGKRSDGSERLNADPAACP